MSTVTIDWDKSFKEFWEKLRAQAPVTARLLDLAGVYYQKVWKEAKTVPSGYEEEPSFRVNKDGQLVGNMSGLVLLGAIALATRHIVLDEVHQKQQPQQAQQEQELARLKAEIQAIKDKLDRFEIR